MSIRIILLSILVLTISAFSNPLPPKYTKNIELALEQAGKNRKELIKALEQAPANQKEAVAFLIGNMPERDLKALTADFILENTRLAFQAKEKFAWCKNLPDSIFYNEVLPYVALNETRENWRTDFINRFSPLVEKCSTIYQAIDSVNRRINKVVKVEYNTKRKRADQSPNESMAQGMASCTGLSIILVDAFRAVGIPARLAGTPLWNNKRGNHNWCEVWIDGQWYFTEYYPDQLNKSWFLADAGKADPSNPVHWIYATSFKKTGISFPCVWDKSIKYVPAENVTDRYIRLYTEQLGSSSLKENEMVVDVVLYKSNNESGEQRVGEKVELLKAGEQVDFGYSPSSTDDLNKYLKFKLQKNTEYVFRYADSAGNTKEIKITTVPETNIVKLFQ